MHGRWKTAFTLIELLVVIAIIAIIAAILFPVFAAVRGKGWQSACLSNQKQIAAAVLIYMQDYDERFPFVLNWSGNSVDEANYGDGGKSPVVRGVTGAEPQFRLVTALTPYVKNEKVWYCPSVGPDFHWDAWRKGMTMRDQGTTYGYTYLGLPCPRDDRKDILLAGKSYGILFETARWPMLWEEPNGLGFTGNISDPPASVVPHAGGLNVAYGDGHVKFHRMQNATYGAGIPCPGDGLIPGQ